MKDLTNIGIITMAFGADKYFHQAQALARSLRRHMPGFRIAIVTDRTDVGPLFDIAVPINPVEVAGTLLKADLYHYSPFEETLFIDSDCIVARPFHEQLKEIRRYDFSPVVNRFLQEGDRDLWIRDVGYAIKTLEGTPFPKFNGGVYFYRKSTFASKVFATAHDINKRADELGILDFDRSGPGEETLLGLALSKMQATDFYDDGGYLMRTPLNSHGPIHLDVIDGSCHFIKEDCHVAPAICHFCGDWINHPAYLVAQEELIAGKKVGRRKKAYINAAYQAERLKKRMLRKLVKTFAPDATHAS
ncbi:hypothetical protein [Paracoccus sp. (in: a-proteobacteria)]|uniref:hypothetical protein n=1 Tax=Paracoccus sp. TaxID=267 RepID=UPI00396CDC88